jgi:3-oxoacyl-[acyl-carrier-protein] synthase-1
MRASHRAPALPILDFSVCTALGASTAETLAGLARDASGLRPCAAPLPFDTVCGALPPLDALPAGLARFDSPVARIAARLFDEVAPTVRRAVARWGGDRVAVVLGTSVGGLAVTERALDHEALHGALPADYGIYQQHGLYAAAELLGLLAGARGPRFAVSTACSSSGRSSRRRSG